MAGNTDIKEQWGITPRIVHDIFDGIHQADEEMEFLLEVSYIEIYMEKIRDLLDPSRTNLRVREDKVKGVWVDGCVKLPTFSPEEMLETMRTGSAHRAIASTRMNMDSSRSHSVFIIDLQQVNRTTGTSTFCLSIGTSSY
jgi:kinesin family protein 5